MNKLKTTVFTMEEINTLIGLVSNLDAEKYSLSKAKAMLYKCDQIFENIDGGYIRVI